ncbi:MAG: hypothetical protein IKP45_01195 [Bacteroidales bacterium]|nr:hypothetical protein [Bacteroidales bacterium]
MIDINKILKIIIVVFAVLLMAGKVLGQFGGGTGTLSDPYKISTATHMATLATNVNGGNSYAGKYFILVSDITGVSSIVGSYSGKPFSGTFDGNCKKITLTITSSSQYAALFSYIKDATIKNVVVNGSVSSSAAFAAAIVGYANNSTIYGCTNNANVNGTVNFAGVVAQIYNNVVVEKCVNNGTVGSSCNNWRRGGVVCNSTNSSIIDCVNNGAVNGTEGLGGIAYSAQSNTIVDRCVNNGAITGNDEPDNGYHNGFGGIVGSCSSVTIRNSYNSGDVYFNAQAVNDSYYFMGGIAGMCEDANVHIENCYNIGNIKTRNNCGYYIGGIAGKSENAKLSNCYNGGKVSNSDGSYRYVGAVTGYITISGEVVNCYSWDGAAVNSYSDDTYNLHLYGTYSVSGCVITDVKWFSHSSTTNTLASSVTVNGTTTTNLLNILNAWINGNSTYNTWLAPTGSSDNNGMPKFYANASSVGSVQNLSVSAVGTNQHNVTWDAVVGASGYMLSWGTTGNLTTSVEINGGNTIAYTHTPLTAGIEYCYRIIPIGTAPYCLDVAPSDEVCVPLCLPISQSPVLTIDAQTDRSVRVSWTSVEHASSYILYYGVNDPNSSTNNVWSVTNATSPMTIPELTNGQQYNFAVMPVGADPYCPENPLSTTQQGTPNCNE